MTFFSYETLEQQYKKQAKSYQGKGAYIGVLRLMIILFLLCCIYYAVTTSLTWNWLIAAFISVVVYVLVVRWHAAILQKQLLAAALSDVNDKEQQFLAGEQMSFNDGVAYIDVHHAYAYDLDLFGKRSLFQHLNRTATIPGDKALAQAFLQRLPVDAIVPTQDAVKVLAADLHWRQHLQAVGNLITDNEQQWQGLHQWANEPVKPLRPMVRVLRFISPLLFILLVTLYIAIGQRIYFNIAVIVYIANLLLLSLHMRQLKAEQAGAAKTDETLQQYAILLQHIETASWQVPVLKDLQQALRAEGKVASQQLHQLSTLFNQLDSLQNPVGTLLFNGSLLYHLYILHSLQQWKAQYASLLPGWLQVLGRAEALSSLANFYYNNPAYTFPVLNTNKEMLLEQLGHPLLPAAKRVCNDVSFSPERFMILSGSNMSGKSTFLRTLGVNMVLAGMGSVVCAKTALLQPLPIIATMRLTDSLADSESFFFAEVKRLRKILDALEQEPYFVLLDEILRGTNSDDKQYGTIEVIHSLLRHKVTGAIATHDLDVCKTATLYPGIVSNHCFEVDIVNDMLAFDYKLRRGICQNKSATFLMRQMKVI